MATARPLVTAFSVLLLTATAASCGAGGSALLGPGPVQTRLAPVQHTRVADFGGLLVNGQSVVVASLNKFAGWAGSGWLRNTAEYEQRLREAKVAGFNTLWVREPPSNFWTTWSLWATANAYDLQGSQEVFNPDRVARIARDPAMLVWFLHSEFHGMTSSYSDWLTTKNRVKSIDPNHVVGDLVMYQAGYPSETTNPYAVMEYPMPEFTISEFAPYTQVLHIVNESQYADRIRARGARFVKAGSVTVVSEFATYINGGRPRIPSREEIFRAFLLLAALNYRAFDVLWGANQVIYSNEQERQQLLQNLEQLRPAIDRAWADTLDAFRLLMGPLYSVVADPAQFTQITDATPRFQLQFDRYVGVYAVRKAVDGTTFVIAVNPEESSLSVSIPVSGSTATDLVTGQSLSLTGGRIAVTLPARAARVYAVR
jgi:hypothetical protein